MICPVSQNKTSIKQSNNKKPQLIRPSQQTLASKSNYTGTHTEGFACELGWCGDGYCCVTVYVLKTGYLCVCLCSGGQEPPQTQKLGLGSGDGDQLHWPRPPCKCTDCPFWNTLTNHFIPEALQTLTSRGGGGGAVPLLAWPPAIRTLGKNSPLLLIQ